ncbi:hypothetical protein KXS07_33425 [Inquilinus limosus]|uniref:sensor histidine kinase n=1 Tax=Inquilinus limosus TaxID=171674 RepID=UPI003F16B6FE
MTDSREQAGSPSLLGRLAHRLRTRPDSEHEMRFNGTGFAVAILLYLFGSGVYDPNAIAVLFVYIALNACVFAHILLYPGICRPRRIFSILNDFVSLFWVMHLGDEITTILFPIYLWVILGNGFRFGIRFLALATTVALASFGTLVATTPFWRSQPTLSAGLIGSMLMVSLCAVPLIRKLSQARRQAEAVNRAKAFLLASVSHELRTPLTAIVGTGSELQDTKLDPAQQEMARRVVSAGERLMALINDISAASRNDGSDADRQPRQGDRRSGRDDPADGNHSGL